jgi:hypothetical protein
MKKLLLFLFSAFVLSTSVSAQVLVPLTVSIEEHDQPLGPGYPKTPITAPTVYIDDYTLLFEVDHPEYVLYIKDEDDNVVYSTVVYSAQTQVVLPSTLSGNYQIELVMGNWLFTGWINLY